MLRRKAFTLSELLIVIMVIALLVAIILPYFQRVFAVQRKMACANHLEKLGQAYAMQCGARRAKGFVGTGLGTLEWQAELLNYVSDSVEVFQCPEDDGTSMGKKATLANYWMDVYPGGNYAGSICLDEDEGDFIWKLSETQWKTFRDMANRNGRQSHGYSHPGYQPDSNPNKYYFAFEDMMWSNNPDRDFYDLNFVVERKGMSINLTITNGVTGYKQYLFLGPRGDPGRQQLFNEDRQNRPLRDHNGETITIEGQSSSSYGMNSMAGVIEAGSKNKVAIMDFERLLVAGSALDETSGDRAEQLSELWIPDPNKPSGAPSFARHFDKANVLFADGAVKLMDCTLGHKDSLHPDDPEVAERYWDP